MKTINNDIAEAMKHMNQTKHEDLPLAMAECMRQMAESGQKIYKRNKMREEEIEDYLKMMKFELVSNDYLWSDVISPNFCNTCETDGQRRKITRAEQLKQDLMYGKIDWQTPIKKEKVSLLPSFVNISIKALI